MDVPYLIMLLQNKLNYLSNARSSAAAVGDLAGVTTIDNDILTTQNTIAQLNLLTQFNQAAQNQNTTPAAVIANVLQNMPTQGPSASAIINGYDISAYATDPLYEQKIQNILSAMPAFTSGVDLTTYIQTLDPGSPVDGGMIVSAAQQYNVDIPLMTAIMQNDSQFGTLGVGAVTNNPGNVGNTGYATHTYASWQEGVNAVAEWLSNHRVSPLVTPPPTLPDPTTPTQPTDQTSTTTSTSTPATSSPAATSTVSSATSTDVVAPSSTTTATTTLDTTLSASSSTPVDTNATSTDTTTGTAGYATSTDTTN